MRGPFLASAALLITSATVSHPRAQDPSALGSPASGVTVSLDANGKIVFQPSDLVVLEDGRQLRRVQGDQFQLFSEDEASDHPVNISGLDFLLRASELIGHRVRVTDGVVTMSDVDRAQFRVKGGHFFARFAGASKDAVKRVILDCSSFMPDEAKCGYNVVGTVEKEYSSPALTDVVLELRKKPATTANKKKR